MKFEEMYFNNKERLLNDKSICTENRKLFKKFFAELEYKLKRINGFDKLDESSYKTLCSYFHRFRNVNFWFNNKDWKKLTKKEIQEVYDKLEDGKLLSVHGRKITGKEDYYNKIFKSLPFELARKTSIVKQVMKYYGKNINDVVTFFTEETHKQIANATDTIKQRLLCWIGWDWGENVFSNLKLQKKDFSRRINSDTNEAEYLLYFPVEKLKRSRVKGISEINNYSETVDLLDIVLKDLDEDDYLFKFEQRQASKFLNKACKKVSAKCLPNSKKPTWKDYRSSMACHLLKIGWTTDEIKKRMRHSPSSKVLNKYVNYLALDRNTPKKKVHTRKISELNDKLNETRNRERNYIQRLESQNEMLITMKKDIDSLKADKTYLILSKFIKKQNQMSLVLENLTGQKFDAVLPPNKISL